VSVTGRALEWSFDIYMLVAKRSCSGDSPKLNWGGAELGALAGEYAPGPGPFEGIFNGGLSDVPIFQDGTARYSVGIALYFGPGDACEGIDLLPAGPSYLVGRRSFVEVPKCFPLFESFRSTVSL